MSDLVYQLERTALSIEADYEAEHPGDAKLMRRAAAEFTALSSEREILREALSKIVRLGIDARKYSLADEMLKVARRALTGVTGG